VQDRIGVNVALEVGQLSETVEVTGAAQALQTDSSYLGQVVESRRIEDLPLNGRLFTRLAVLTSGTLPTAPGARDERTGGSARMAFVRTKTATCLTASTTTAFRRT
jgi:hypothetical protein